MTAGKGDTQRPFNAEKFNEQFDWAFDVICKKCDHYKQSRSKQIIGAHCMLHKIKPESCEELNVHDK